MEATSDLPALSCVHAATQQLLDASKVREYEAFHDFIGALCKLSVEMASMQSGISTISARRGAHGD